MPPAEIGLYALRARLKSFRNLLQDFVLNFN